MMVRDRVKRDLWGGLVAVAMMAAMLPIGAAASQRTDVRWSQVEADSAPVAQPSGARDAGVAEPEPSPPEQAEAAAEPQPCASPTPGAPEESGPLDCVAVQSLNPSVIGSGSPKVSDRSDGVDEVFDLVAVVSNGLPGMVVKSTLVSGANRIEGELQQVQGSSDTWTLPLDLATSLPEGTATFTVDAFRSSQPGAQLLSSDTVTVDIQHKDPPPAAVPNPTATDIPAAETAALTWPTQNGPLGFYRPVDGQWRTVIDGLLSTGANATYTVYYTTTAIGREPIWTSCGTGSNPPPRESDGIRPFSASCLLAEQDLPSRVTAVAVVPQRTVPTATSTRTDIGSADVHRVQPYIQSVQDMKIVLRSLPPGSATTSWPSGARRQVGTGCLDLAASVTDGFDRPVQGANVDVELLGPGDSVSFGSGASNFKVPVGFPEQEGSNCSGGAAGAQATFAFDEGPDAKRLESDQGSGLSGGGAGIGEWRFKVFSPTDEWGKTRIYAWVDDQPRAAETDEPGFDNEMHDGHEPLAALDLQWLEQAISVTSLPLKDVAPVDSCNPYEIKVAGGSVPVGGVNVDVHIRGPADEVRFCKPPGAAELRVPDAGEHGTEEEPGGDTHPANTPHCTGEGKPCIHREGETDDAGRLIFGLSSDIAGATNITAWFDGEPGNDDDLNNLTGTSVGVTTSWISGPADAKLSLTNPSSYAGVRTISSDQFRIVASVDAPFAVKGVDIELAGDAGAVLLGRAKQIAGGNTYELVWDLEASPLPGQEEGAEPAPVPDGAYTIRAKLAEQGTAVEQVVTVARGAPAEWAQISSPVNGTAVSLVDRTIKISGTASTGAEGLDLYYSVSGPGEPATWNTPSCGYVDLAGNGADVQEFEGVCTLAAAHMPRQVTGVAAVAIDCTLLAGCDASATGTPIGRQPVTPEAGDAIRVQGCSDLPCVVVGPSEAQAKRKTCQDAYLLAVDDRGPIETEITAELDDPFGSAMFCDPETLTGAMARTAHLTARTDASGVTVVGVTSSKGSFKSIFSEIEESVTTLRAWIDGDSNGARDGGEPGSTSVFHWILPGRCTVVGTNGDDELFPVGFPSKICGLGGDDVINGLDGATGHDIILGGPGNDTIYGLRGDDTIRGGTGNDVILGDKGNDKIYGGGGDDDLFGDAGEDKLDGGPGSDGCSSGKNGAKKRSCERKAKAPTDAEE